MFAKVFVVLAIVSAVSAGRLVRDAPADVSFSNVLDTAGKNWNEFNSELLKFFGVENNEQLQQKTLDQGKAVANQLDVWATDIKKETEALKDNSAIKELRASVDKAIEEYKSKNPETAAEVQAYVEKANKGTEEILSKLKGLGETEEAKNIKDLSKKLLDSTVSAFENIAKDIKEGVKH